MSEQDRDRAQRSYFDVAVIIPLEEELEEVLTVFPQEEDHSTEVTFRYAASGIEGLRVLVAKQDGMGKNHAVNATAGVLRDFDIGLVVCLGIAGSLTDDLRLGDVCYSTSIADVLDNTKMSDRGEGELDLALSPTHYPTDKSLFAAFGFMRLKADLRGRHEEWAEGQGAKARALISDPVPGRGEQTETLGAPKSKEGVIVCGAVTDSDTYNAKLKKVDRKVLAVETESGGVCSVAQGRNVPTITIRGVSDHADASKKKLEAGTANLVRKIAATNAATFLRLQLDNPMLRGILERRRSSDSGEASAEAKVAPMRRDLTQVIEEAQAHINNALRELSPEFKLQARGYQLPTPRIRELSQNKGIGDTKRRPPEDLRVALEAKRSILIQLPRTYPDLGLPWVLADNLLATEIGGKRALPIVIPGGRVAPPRSGLSHFAVPEVDGLTADDGLQIVYIIDDLPISSKSRLAYLKREIESATEAKFVFISRDDAHLVELAEFANEEKAGSYNLCSISFEAMTHFIEKNFGLTGTESEVIAKRLSDTFDQFDLSAHPTYFAGIPKETLSALLQANRRTELIQLAVDGFLTFLVAADRSDIRLSRTVRSRYLRGLAIEINVEKRNFSQEELVAYTRAFAAEYDYAIDPLNFIQSFHEKGILHFSDGRVRFSLPFIEAYLLASEMNSLPDVASRYFDLTSEDFDMSTFDLYSEIGASQALVAAYRAQLDAKIVDYKVPDGEIHILLTDKLQPALLNSPDRVNSLHTRLQKALEDVRSNKGDVKAKQKILDVADHVQEATNKPSRGGASQKGDTPSDAADEGNEVETRLNEAVRVWVTGVVLLGSGAEHLKAPIKQELSKKLVVLGSAIIHHWTSERHSIDFKSMKETLTRDDYLRKFAGFRAREGEGIDELRPLVRLIVDVTEYFLLSQPLRCLADFLCEHARHRVLASSVERATFDNAMEKVVHSAWLADIESRLGTAKLDEAIRALPSSAFLRTNLAAHFLTRVHWSHWKMEDRLALLEAAGEALKPLAISLNKGEIRRSMAKTAAETDTSATKRGPV